MRPFRTLVTTASLASHGDVDGLLAALGGSQRDMVEDSTGEYLDLGTERRVSAARFLSNFSGDAVITGLVAALRDRAPRVRIEALRSLVTRAEPVDEPLVAGVLQWPERLRAEAESLLWARAEGDAAAAARMALAYLATDESSGALLSDRWARVVIRSVSAADKQDIVGQALRAGLTAEGAAPRSLQILRGEPATSTPLLVASLRDSRMRLTAVHMLGQLGASAATHPLVELLEDPDAAARREAAVALGAIKDPRAIEALLRATADDEYEVRVAALEAVDLFGNAGLVWGIVSAARGALAGITELGDGETATGT